MSILFNGEMEAQGAPESCPYPTDTRGNARMPTTAI